MEANDRIPSETEKLFGTILFLSGRESLSDNEYIKDRDILERGGVEARRLIDDVSRRNKGDDSYRGRAFNGSDVTADEYTGKKVSMPGTGNGTDDTANVDHVIPLKRIIEEYKNHRFLKAEDLKRIANQDANLRITSENINKSKSDKFNTEDVRDQIGKGEFDENTYVNMINADYDAAKAIESGVRKAQIHNASEAFKDGAKESIYSNMVCVSWTIIRNGIELYEGNISIDEAIDNLTGVIGSVTKEAVYSGGRELIMQGFPEYIKEVDCIAQVAGICAIIGDDVVGVLSGNLTLEEAADNIIEKGAHIFIGCASKVAGVKAVEVLSKTILKSLTKTATTIASGGISFFIDLGIEYTLNQVSGYIEKEVQESKDNYEIVVKEYELTIKECNKIRVNMLVNKTVNNFNKMITFSKSRDMLNEGIENRDINSFVEGINGFNQMFSLSNRYSSGDFDKFCLAYYTYGG